MSPRARRFFGCALPLTLAAFGCGALGLIGYAGQVVVQQVRVTTRAMEPVLEQGWTVLVNNTAFWAREPVRGTVITVGSPEGLRFRRIYGLPGETIEVRAGTVYIDGEPSAVRDRAHGSGPDFGPRLLGPDEYFVLAEDRSFNDSRVWGPLSRSRLYGVAMFYFPAGSLTIQPVDPTPTPPSVERTPKRPTAVLTAMPQPVDQTPTPPLAPGSVPGATPSGGGGTGS